jgi:predicted ATPase
MKIKSLVIENFKSIERIELIEPNPFTVFVGPNGSGKSNIFEALEFVNLRYKIPEGYYSLFGGPDSIKRRQNPIGEVKCDIEYDDLLFRNADSMAGFGTRSGKAVRSQDKVHQFTNAHPEYEKFFINFSRLFIKNERLVKLAFSDDQRLSLSTSNLEKVLKRTLRESTLKEEIFEWLELFVPGFKAVEVDDRDELHWFEHSSSEYFTKDLISDGTYNILALLTAVYQSDDKPQFLCIEEPENGLHPQVAAELVDFFRIMCEERGHYIWLNTHSQSMASRVRPNEFVVVEKKDGATITRQFRNEDFNGMSVDEAWLTNALNGGLAW